MSNKYRTVTKLWFLPFFVSNAIFPPESLPGTKLGCPSACWLVFLDLTANLTFSLVSLQFAGFK